jgi:two-component system CheB/CheR fusion protein
MPKAAKQTGLVDLELTPDEIAVELARVNGHRQTRAASRTAAPPAADAYDDILGIIDKEAGADFTLYKQSAIRRRIDRRVVATRSDDVMHYADYLRSTPGEAKLLFQDILISVTSFFRDAQAFKALEQRLREQIKAKPASAPYRCWIVGCATGEEAYTLGMLLIDICEGLKKSINFQIFGTDLDEHALAIGRKGSYPKASLVEVPKAFRERYFNVIDDRFQVNPARKRRPVA